MLVGLDFGEQEERAFTRWILIFFLLLGLLLGVWSCWQDNVNSYYRMVDLQHIWWKVKWKKAKYVNC
jgi:hypothetical protein